MRAVDLMSEGVTAAVGRDVARLWEDEGVQRAWARKASIAFYGRQLLLALLVPVLQVTVGGVLKVPIWQCSLRSPPEVVMLLFRLCPGATGSLASGLRHVIFSRAQEE